MGTKKLGRIDSRYGFIYSLKCKNSVQSQVRKYLCGQDASFN